MKYMQIRKHIDPNHIAGTATDRRRTERRARLPQTIVLLGTAALLLLWVALHAGQLTATQNGGIRFFLTALFSLIILLRHKPGSAARAESKRPPAILAGRWGIVSIVALGAAGTCSLILGLMFRVHQAEWLGLLILCFAGLKWSLPARFGRDLALSFFLLYWAHPLPSQVFGPFQLAMQELSVRGSEWLLHVFNVRVWADGLVLRTELTTCEVPEWCSGMRTATTVFLLGLGLGMIKRLRWYGCAIFVAAAVFQALVLNIIRISAVAVLTPKLSQVTSAEFLHNTMNVVVVAAALVVYAELSFLERHRRKKSTRAAEPHYEHDRLITKHPPFWKSIINHRRIILLVLVLTVLSAGVGYKSRPYHRMEMIGDLVTSLINLERYEEAEKAVDIVSAFWPEDDEWMFTRIRILLARKKYQEVLTALDDLPARDPARKVQKEVLRAYSLMGLGRLDEAADIVSRLPRDTRENDPRVGMILAEMGFRSDDPESVASHVVTASRWQPNTPRIRMLYPYLRTYRKWDAIAKSDIKQPFSEPAQALSAAEAYMNLNQAPMVATMVIQAMKDWPTDIRVLEPLFFLAIKHTHPKWEQYFSMHLRRSVAPVTDPEVIYPLFDRCFRLSRPDLAWFLCRHIQECAPQHPVLPLVVTRFGAEWFLFRRRFLGFAAGRSTDTIDVADIIRAGACFAMWQPDAEQIPFGNELMAGDLTRVRKEHLRKAIAMFAPLADSGTLSISLHYEYVWALEVSSGVDAARDELKRLVALHPSEEDNARIRLSEVYEDAAEWESVYETLRGYLGSRVPRIDAVLRLCQAQRMLRLGIGALHTAREAVRLFPDSTRAATMLADVLMTQDSNEEALMVLARPRRWHDRDVDIMMAQVLQKTQRFGAADAVRRSTMLPRTLLPGSGNQRMFLAPAELSVLWHRVSLPSRSDFDKNAAAVRRTLRMATSPFLRKMLGRWTECYTEGCTGTLSELEWWSSCGRDNIERAIALNQYTLLLCHQRKYDAARAAAEEAVKHLPGTPILWHILISLADGDRETIRHARTACPDDSEIWLADLVTGTLPETAGPATAKEHPLGIPNEALPEDEVIRQLENIVKAKSPVFPAAAMARGGEYLYRIGMERAASIAARDASDRALTLLPAHVLAVKCALVERDKEWALSATKLAIDASLNPPPIFFRKLIELRTEGRQIPVDSEIIEALRNLRRKDPDNPLWAEMLGYVRFKRGGWEIVEALSEMSDALEKGARSKSTYVIAGECARLLGNFERAEELIRRGLSLYPDDIALRNNLAFVLVHRPDGIEEATSMAEALSSERPDDIEIMDTLAVIYLHAGRFDVARDIVNSILDKTDEGAAPWFRAKTHLADIALQMREPEQAIDILTDLLRSAEGIPDADLLKANDLFVQARVTKGRQPDVGTNAPSRESGP